MDEDRRIRFLVAPFIFLASLAWGIVRDPCVNLASLLPGVELKLNDLPGIVAAIAGGGLALFPLGYAIGVISYVGLRLIFGIVYLFGFGSTSHEVCFPEKLLPSLWKVIEMPGKPHRRDVFFAGAEFDYDLLRTKYLGIHNWLFRRWSAFNIAVTSITALLLSLLVGQGLLKIVWHNEWQCAVYTLCIILFVSALFAWKDTMGMLAFMLRKLESTPDLKGQ